MPIAFISDIHIGQYWKNNNKRARKLISYLKLNLEGIIKSFNNDGKLDLIIGGDVYNSPQANTEMLVEAMVQLNPLFEKFRKVSAICGNHETFLNKDGEQRSLLRLGLQTKNSKVYDDLIGVDTDFLDRTDVNFIFIPYQHGIKDIIMSDNYLNKVLNKDMHNIIVSHFTPNEVFSFSEFKIQELLNRYKKYSIPYIFLGDYHTPMTIRLKPKTTLISIGSTYWSNIADFKSYCKENHKKFYILNDDMTIATYNLMLPNFYTITCSNQLEFEEIIPQIKSSVNKDQHIIFLRSNSLIDYSSLIADGYDIYYELIEDEDNRILDISKSNLNIEEALNSGKKIEDRWSNYLQSITLDSDIKAIADKLFIKRMDQNITYENLIEAFQEKEVV